MSDLRSLRMRSQQALEVSDKTNSSHNADPSSNDGPGTGCTGTPGCCCTKCLVSSSSCYLLLLQLVS